MPLEAGDGFISGLVATNPVNATDQVAEGDDHIRLIKTALKGTFPNLNAAVNATPAQLNVLQTDGAGAGMLADIAAIADPNADRVLGWDDSAGAAIAFSLSTGLTSSGTALQIDTAVVPQLGASNTFTGVTQTVTGASAIWQATDGGVQAFLRATSAASEGRAGVFSAHAFSLYTNSQPRLTISSAGDYNFRAGLVTTNNASAQEVGYKGTPFNTQDANYTLVLGDLGKTIYKSAGGAGETITIPANASVAFPVGTQIDVVNNGGGDLTIAITTDTLSWTVGGATGSRTLADHGWCVLKKVATAEWFISGVGVS